jgi:hypothetical protein
MVLNNLVTFMFCRQVCGKAIRPTQRMATFNIAFILATSRSISDHNHARASPRPTDLPVNHQLSRSCRIDSRNSEDPFRHQLSPALTVVFLAEETILLALRAVSSISNPRSSH